MIEEKAVFAMFVVFDAVLVGFGIIVSFNLVLFPVPCTVFASPFFLFCMQVRTGSWCFGIEGFPCGPCR